MNTKTIPILGAAGAVAVVAGILLTLQGFDAGKVACTDIQSTRAQLNGMYETGVSLSVEIYAEEKIRIDEALSRCLSASPTDPCADLQQARDAKVEAFNSITSPADNAPYSEFQKYFSERDDAYASYKKAKEALDACRMKNPPKELVPYEESDTKACFDTYDASVTSIHDVFERDTQALRAALQRALSALDAREKACHPPTGKEKFTKLSPGETGEEGGISAERILSCKPVHPETDAALLTLRQKAALLPAEIASLQTTIDNAEKREGKLKVDLSEVDTYIPAQSTKTQYEGALNALRAERKVAIEASLEFYQNLISRKETEKAAREQELRDIEARIAARIKEINEENEKRQRQFPTSVHLAGPDTCEYFHCHGVICGQSDPDPNGCGHGVTSESDSECKEFLEAYLQEGAQQ